MFDTGMANYMLKFGNNVFTGFQHELAVNTFGVIRENPHILITGIEVFYICLGISLVCGILFLKMTRFVRGS